MPTRFEKTYVQINQELDGLIEKYGYETKSAAFCHMIVKLYCNATDEEACNSIVDGFDDNGIDAIYIDEKNNNHVYFFQAKFANSLDNINAGVQRAEILKLCEGYEHFVGNDEKFNLLSWNDLIKEKREEFVEVDDSNHSIIVVRFTTSQDTKNESSLKSKCKDISSKTGNHVSYDFVLAEKITELYEKYRLNNWPNFEFKYKKDLSPFEDEYARVFLYYVSLRELYNGIKDIKSNVFEGNVRYFDNGSKVNAGIMNTLMNDCARFHLLNNGITIVCSNTKNKSSTNTFRIEKGSIINGAQTVGCIIKILESMEKEHQDLSKFDNAFITIKVIQLEEKMDLVDQLVYTLNTQNQMKNSYVISNNLFIKSIQSEINKKTKYFLQIKNQEFNFQKNNNVTFDKLSKNIIEIENAIQAFVAYENIDGTSYLAKNGKGLLFDGKYIDKIIDKIDSIKLVRDYEYYLEIMNITKMYRSYRKDNGKKQIISALKIDEVNIDDYRFINTGNYLILSALGEYCQHNNVEDLEGSLLIVLKKLAEYFKEKDHIPNLTKKKETFTEVASLFSDSGN